ncbi:MAG: hypothetical protein E7057_02625 [Lentisphaerae bacterium]|nr:hypothetical protein [Lentisphaerota bacterium]
MIVTAVLFTLLSGCAMASVYMIVSRIAREQISFFQFYTVSNLIAGSAAWMIFPEWSIVPDINWLPVLLMTGGIALVNVMSQGALVCAFKWGHNGLTVAIRNSASMLSMFWGILFLHEKVSIVNFAGAVLMISALALIALSGKKGPDAPNLKKWLPAALCSMLFSGAYQIILSGTALLPENVHKAGVLVPCLMTFCGIGNFLASLVENRIAPRQQKFWHFPKKVLQVMGFWVFTALVQYFLLVRALAYMQKAGMSSLAWPMLVGINVGTFSLFCRLKWKEKYNLSTIIGMLGCISGLILIIWGRK